ncbi:MAG: polysaccharide deacetylase family protein [Acidiferrobacterales bacterium]
MGGRWALLDHELDCWATVGRVATFWWRDDDAVRCTPALDRLLALSRKMDVPIALAVIPSLARRELSHCLGAYPHTRVLQHGYAHRNYAPAGMKATEFDLHRPRRRVIAELLRGSERLNRLFPDQVLPILVPPWNRIDRALLSELPRLGLSGLSTFRARDTTEAVPGLRQANCHVDLIDWRHTGHFVGWDRALGEVVAHLEARRAEQVDPDEPTGLLTHHLDHDRECWHFLEAFLNRTQKHLAVHWLDAREAMWPA